MADFCKQCSIELFGFDGRDFVSQSAPPLRVVVCEDCGGAGSLHTVVDREGRCVYKHCRKHASINNPSHEVPIKLAVKPLTSGGVHGMMEESKNKL